jgi:hypothetical protein
VPQRDYEAEARADRRFEIRMGHAQWIGMYAISLVKDDFWDLSEDQREERARIAVAFVGRIFDEALAREGLLPSGDRI